MIYRKKIKKSNVEKVCSFCNLPIHPGTKFIDYIFYSQTPKPRMFGWRNHFHCQKIHDCLNMSDLNENGITAEDFQQSIRLENQKNNPNSINNTTEDFAEILTMVCAYYGIELNQPFKSI